MKTIRFAAATTVLALPLLTACADPSLAREADELRATLTDLPGVNGVDLAYTKPVILDSAKLTIRVDMRNDANRDAILGVVTTTYKAFAGTHHREEGDLDVTTGDDTIHVRSFEPDADATAVTDAARHALTVHGAGSVQADINTQDVAKDPHVFTTYAITIEQYDGDAVLDKLADLAATHGDIPRASWGVQTGDHGPSWQLSSSSGFPTSKQRDLFNDLRTDLPSDASILLTDDFATIHVPSTTTPDEVSAMVERQLARMGGVKKAFYDVVSGENFYAMISVGDCTFSTDAVGTRLKKDFGSNCTSVDSTS